MERLSVEDLLIIAENALGIPAERIAQETRLAAAARALAAPFAAERGTDAYPGLADKAAVLCARLVREHPLPVLNNRIALLAMLELVARNDGVFVAHDAEQDELAAMVDELADRELSEAAFVAWVRARVRSR